MTPEQYANKLAINKRWYHNADAGRKAAKQRHINLKHEVFAAYGGQCQCCGESDLHFLTIDHVEQRVPDRHKHPSGRRISGTAFLALLKSEGYPTDCRVMCWNCNCAHAYYGFCPHQPHTSEQRRYQ